MSGLRLGLFGGTFDPIHFGHLYIANAVLAQADLDRVLFVPVAQPAHRAAHAPPDHRAVMVVRAIEGNDRFAFDDSALRQAGPAYTADTLPLVRDRYPDAQFSFIAGSDSLLQSRWQRLEDVLSALERFYVVARERTATVDLQPVLRDLPAPLAQRFTVLHLPFVDVSASALREAVARGEPIRYLTPDAVVEYIERNGLYRAAQSSPA